MNERLKIDDNYDQALEQTLVALILRDTSALEMLGRFGPDDLADPQCQRMLAAAMALYEEDKNVSAVTMRTRLGLSGETAAFDEIGALQAFSMGEQLPSIIDVLDGLRDASSRREAQRLAKRLMVLAADPSTSIEKALVDTLDKADAILADARPQGQTTFLMREAVDKFAGDLSRTDVPYVATTFKGLDDVITGLPIGELSILAGRPSMGKSALALSLAMRVAAMGQRVLYVSQEMPNPTFMARVASACHGAPHPGSHVVPSHAIPYRRIKPGVLSADDAEKVVRSMYEKGAPLPMMLDYRRGVTVANVTTLCRRARAELGSLDLVVVDHIGLMTPPANKNSTRANDVAALCHGLNKIAADENVAMLALSQVNRAAEAKEDKRPDLENLKDSGVLEENASVVMFVFRPVYHLERKLKVDPEPLREDQLADLQADANKMEVIVSKNRSGSVGVVSLWVDMPNNIVEDV